MCLFVNSTGYQVLGSNCENPVTLRGADTMFNHWACSPETIVSIVKVSLYSITVIDQGESLCDSRCSMLF